MKKYRWKLVILVIIVWAFAWYLWQIDTLFNKGAQVEIKQVNQKSSEKKKIYEIVSDDGDMTLTVDSSTLPNGVAKDDIVIQAVDTSWKLQSEEGQVESIGFELSPDGMQLNAPAKITITVPWDLKNDLYLLHFSDEGKKVEILSPEIVRYDEEQQLLTISAEIAHFSRVEYLSTSARLFAAFMDPIPGQTIWESFFVPIEFRKLSDEMVYANERGDVMRFVLDKDEPWYVVPGKYTPSHNVSPWEIIAPRETIEIPSVETSHRVNELFNCNEEWGGYNGDWPAYIIYAWSARWSQTMTYLHMGEKLDEALNWWIIWTILSPLNSFLSYDQIGWKGDHALLNDDFRCNSDKPSFLNVIDGTITMDTAPDWSTRTEFSSFRTE